MHTHTRTHASLHARAHTHASIQKRTYVHTHTHTHQYLQGYILREICSIGCRTIWLQRWERLHIVGGKVFVKLCRVLCEGRKKPQRHFCLIKDTLLCVSDEPLLFSRTGATRAEQNSVIKQDLSRLNLRMCLCWWWWRAGWGVLSVLSLLYFDKDLTERCECKDNKIQIKRREWETYHVTRVLG